VVIGGPSTHCTPAKPTRITENFDVFDVELSADELARIDALDTGRRGGPDPDTVDPSQWEIVIPEP
jgi:2,5-diketo-D-gluconate reductase A